MRLDLSDEFRLDLHPYAPSAMFGGAGSIGLGSDTDGALSGWSLPLVRPVLNFLRQAADNG